MSNEETAVVANTDLAVRAESSLAIQRTKDQGVLATVFSLPSCKALQLKFEAVGLTGILLEHAVELAKLQKSTSGSLIVIRNNYKAGKTTLPMLQLTMEIKEAYEINSTPLIMDILNNLHLSDWNPSLTYESLHQNQQLIDIFDAFNEAYTVSGAYYDFGQFMKRVMDFHGDLIEAYQFAVEDMEGFIASLLLKKRKQ